MVKWIRNFDNLVFTVAVLVVASGSLGYAYSWVEGYINPVMGPLSVSNARRGPNEYDVTFDGEAYKIRGDCTWLASRWYIGERFEQSVSTTWDFSGKPQIREGGQLYWKDQISAMSPEELFHNSHADVVHRCPWQLWNTVTPFYDSNDDVPIPQLGPPVRTPLEQEVQSLREELEQLK